VKVAASAGDVRRGRPLALAAGALVLITLALYVVVIMQQSSAEPVRVGAVVVLLLAALAGVGGVIGAVPAELRAVSGTAAAGLLVSLGVLGMFSVGLPLFVAGVLMIVWIVRSGSLRVWRVVVLATFLVCATLPWVLIALT
jgi:hypothetical protein